MLTLEAALFLKTTAERLTEQGANLLDDIAVLLGDPKPLRDLNLPSDPVIFITAHYCFPELPLEKKRLQSRLRDNYNHFIIVVRALLKNLPEPHQRDLDGWDKTIVDVIEQNHVWHATSEEAMDAARHAINAILAATSTLYDHSENSVVLVPDTNALIQMPVIQNWRFANFTKFEMLLIPTVLAELDDLKIRHRNS